MLNMLKWLIILLSLFFAGTSCQGVSSSSYSNYIIDDPHNPNTLMLIEKTRIKNINIPPESLTQEQIEAYDLQNIQQTLRLHRPHVAVLSYFFSDSLLYLHFITSKSFSAHPIKLYPAITADIKLLNERITKKTPEQYSEYVKASKRLYDCLLSPIAEQSNGYEWLIIPDGYLYTLNFGSLALPPTPTEDHPLAYNWTQLTFLAGEVTISYAPSIITTLKLLNEKETTSRSFYTPDNIDLKNFFTQNQLSEYINSDEIETNDIMIAHLENSSTIEKFLKNTSVLRIELRQPTEIQDFLQLYKKCFEHNIRNIITTTPIEIKNENNSKQLYYDFYCVYLEMRSAPYALRSAQQNRIGHPDMSLPYFWANERVWGL